MNQLTPAEIEKAHRIWYVKNGLQKPEQDLAPFLSSEIQSFAPTREGWLKRTRNLMSLSGEAAARKMGISRAAYAKFEEGEALGTISLSSLDKAAKALDCELVYALRPRNKKLHSESLWKTLFQTVKNHPSLQSCDPHKKSETIVGLITQLTTDGEFRKSQGWSQRK